MTKRKQKFSPASSIWLLLLALFGLGLLMLFLLQGKDVILFNPKGFVANEQLKLMTTATLIMLEIAIPVLFMFYFFAWKYRETNEKATRDPHAGQGRLFAFAIWTFPIITMLLLVTLLVPATHRLEPQKPIDDTENPLTIQVVAMRWKWLFIYPDQGIATVNYVQLPVDTPVQFELTADETPMSSFWIPHLGGQLYAMTEHVNRLNLKGDTIGDFEGSVAEINGAGFAGMRFTTRVSTEADFNQWVDETRASPGELNAAEYQKLLEPSENHQVTMFSNPSPNIYSTILSKYAGGHTHDAAPAEYKGH